MVADFVDFLIRSHALEEKCREDSIYGLTPLKFLCHYWKNI